MKRTLPLLSERFSNGGAVGYGPFCPIIGGRAGSVLRPCPPFRTAEPYPAPYDALVPTPQFWSYVMHRSPSGRVRQAEDCRERQQFRDVARCPAPDSQRADGTPSRARGGSI